MGKARKKSQAKTQAIDNAQQEGISMGNIQDEPIQGVHDADIRSPLNGREIENNEDERDGALGPGGSSVRETDADVSNGIYSEKEDVTGRREEPLEEEEENENGIEQFGTKEPRPTRIVLEQEDIRRAVEQARVFQQRYHESLAEERQRQRRLEEEKQKQEQEEEGELSTTTIIIGMALAGLVGYGIYKYATRKKEEFQNERLFEEPPTPVYSNGLSYPDLKPSVHSWEATQESSDESPMETLFGFDALVDESNEIGNTPTGKQEIDIDEEEFDRLYDE